MGAIRWLRRGVLLAGLGAAGGALIVTARHFLETPQPLKSALPGAGRIDRKHGGDIYYNVAGNESAEPIVLLHDLYPGASNFEYRHLFPRLAPTWRVYAPDWLGFGMSEHPPLAYTGEFYANTLVGFLRDVVGRPAVVVARGRAANIAARAAAEAPDLFTRLVLVSPEVEAGIRLEPRPSQLLARAAQRVSLGLVPYAFLSTKPLLRRMAHARSAQTGEQSAGEDTVEHLYASTHQFGGQHALMALMTGELDLPLQNVFPLLQPPVLLVSGDEDPAHPADVMEELAILNPYADLDVLVGAGEAVFEDQPAMFAEALTDWLATAPVRQYPQVEESNPTLLSDAELAAELADAELATFELAAAEMAAAELAAAELAAASESVTSGPALGNPSETPEVSEDAGWPEEPDVAESIAPDTLGNAASETSETSESASEPAEEHTRGPARRSGSTPARRATSRSVSAAAEEAGETKAPEAEQPQRATRRARQSPVPRSQPGAGTSSTRKPSSRASRAKSAADAKAEDTGGARKRPKRSKNPDSQA